MICVFTKTTVYNKIKNKLSEKFYVRSYFNLLRTKSVFSNLFAAKMIIL